MALSPYLKPSVLNGGLFGSNKGLAGAYTLGGQGKDFDKRNATEFVNNQTLSETISSVKTISEMLTNAVGSRSPYYTIGEIQSTNIGKVAARYFQDVLGNMVRAIAPIGDDGQRGVIIDGFGTISGKIDVELTKNPVVFVGSGITDNRMRNPNTVTMTVYVSNLYHDDGIGAAVDYLTAFDPTGIAAEAVNALAKDGNTRAQRALYSLKTIQESGQPFTVYTPHGVYENMLIKSLSPKTTAENVDMLECEVVFQEIIMFQPYSSGANKNFPTRTTVYKDGILPGYWNEGNLSKQWQKIKAFAG